MSFRLSYTSFLWRMKTLYSIFYRWNQRIQSFSVESFSFSQVEAMDLTRAELNFKLHSVRKFVKIMPNQSALLFYILIAHSYDHTHIKLE